MKQKLRLFDFTLVMVSLVIGMGIFRTASTSAKAANNPTVFFAAWILGGVVALCGMLTYAEIGSRFPVTGGYYRVFSYTYHPSIAFAVNCIILISNAASLTGVALIGAGYISQVFFATPLSDVGKAIIAFGCIFLFYGVNLSGLKMTARTQSILMLIKISMILMLIAALFMPSIYHAEAATTIFQPTSVTQWARALGVALVAVSFTYGGYQQTINFGNEVENAPKTIPRGIFFGIIIIISLYLLVNFSYYKILGFDDLKSTNEIAGVVASKMFGTMGGKIFSGLLFLSVLAYVNGQLLSNPRVMFAMSEDGVLPKILQKKTKQKEVLVVSLTIYAALCIVILFFAKTFDELLSFVIFLDCIGMATSGAAIFKLRKETKHLNGSGIYEIKMYPLIPLIFIGAYVFVALGIAVDTPSTALTALCVLTGFLILYFITHKKRTSK
jgi:basic amino acid/polyamine antiporter, APA family